VSDDDGGTSPNSEINLAFLRRYWALRKPVQDRAREQYRLWRGDPSHPGLQFKRVSSSLPLWSVRVDRDHRAAGLYEGGLVTWFFIGTHAEYDRLLSNAKARVRTQRPTRPGRR
jgi:hypothetical protein